MAMKDPLAKLFGGTGRIKIMRLFIAKPIQCFATPEIVRQTKTIKTTVNREVKLLEQIGFLKKTVCVAKEIKKTKDKGPDKIIEKEMDGHFLNREFDHLPALRILLSHVSQDQGEDLLRRIRKTGRIKAIIISGVFLEDTNARADILVVGDAIKHRPLESAIRATEAEMGKDLRYAVFSSNEFIYRKEMHDKLIYDIFDSPHRKLLYKFDI